MTRSVQNRVGLQYDGMEDDAAWDDAVPEELMEVEATGFHAEDDDPMLRLKRRSELVATPITSSLLPLELSRRMKKKVFNLRAEVDRLML
jgi:hypothetical protein